jgi:hypothetical protein
MTFRQYVPSGSFDFVFLIIFCRPVSQTMSVFLCLENYRTPCFESSQKPILVQHISTRQLLSSDSGSKASGDVVLVVTFWLKYATVLSLRFTVRLFQRLSSELLIMYPTVHLACHPHAFEHGKRCRQSLHGAEERLVMKQSVCGPAVQLRV